MRLIMGKTEAAGGGDGEQLVIGAIGVESMARCTTCDRALGFTDVVGARSGRLYRTTWACSTCGASLRITDGAGS